MPRYSKSQQIFCLCMLAYMADFREGSAVELRTYMAEALPLMLQWQAVIDLIGEWDLVWGPDIYQSSGSNVADNTMFVSRSRTDPLLVVSIAGTNPNSWYGWLIEDFDVRQTLLWPSYTGDPPGLNPHISQGTDIGLQILTEKMRVDAQTLFEFLSTFMTRQTEPLEIAVTGHSLGGALAPALALNMADKQPVWDPDGLATISFYAYAGATCGDADFARYAEAALSGNSHRIWNKLDMVPHAWNKKMMAQTSHLYEPHLHTNWLMKTLVHLFSQLGQWFTRHTAYTHIAADTPGLPGKVVKGIEWGTSPLAKQFKRLPAYLQQAGYQHLIAYYELLETTAFQNLMGHEMPQEFTGPDLETLKKIIADQNQTQA